MTEKEQWLIYKTLVNTTLTRIVFYCSQTRQSAQLKCSKIKIKNVPFFVARSYGAFIEELVGPTTHLFHSENLLFLLSTILQIDLKFVQLICPIISS